MKKATTKTTPRKKLPVLNWSDDEVATIGVDRRELTLAWLLLHGASEKAALEGAGYLDMSIHISEITSKMSYARGHKVVLWQYTQTVVLPQALRSLQSVAKDQKAMPAARVGAASRLLEVTNAVQKRIEGDVQSVEHMSIEQVEHALRTIEDHRASQARPIAGEVVDAGPKRGQSPVDTDYLSDMID